LTRVTITVPDTLTLPTVTPLMGHTSPDTAYVVKDYPYGGMRCKIRYWIETGAKGATKGKKRVVSQTTNPKRPGEVWNKPKPGSTYSLFAYLYLNHANNHVEWMTIPFGTGGDEDTRVRHMGIYAALGDEDRARYDAVLRLSRKHNPTVWADWDSRVAALARYMRKTGKAPTITDDGMWTDPGHSAYLHDPAAYVTAALELMSSQDTADQDSAGGDPGDAQDEDNWDATETVTVTAGVAKFLAGRLRGRANVADPDTDPAADVTVTLSRKLRALVVGFLVLNDDPDQGGVNHDGIELGEDTWTALSRVFPYNAAAPDHTPAELAAAQTVFPRSLFDKWAAAHPWDGPDADKDDNYYPHAGY
jgi:hypothetical protein